MFFFKIFLKYLCFKIHLNKFLRLRTEQRAQSVSCWTPPWLAHCVKQSANCWPNTTAPSRSSQCQWCPWNWRRRRLGRLGEAQSGRRRTSRRKRPRRRIEFIWILLLMLKNNFFFIFYWLINSILFFFFAL